MDLTDQLDTELSVQYHQLFTLQQLKWGFETRSVTKCCPAGVVASYKSSVL